MEAANKKFKPNTYFRGPKDGLAKKVKRTPRLT
jgi:hypothetical protein